MLGSWRGHLRGWGDRNDALLPHDDCLVREEPTLLHVHDVDVDERHAVVGPGPLAADQDG
jgi:hypothetical protein